MWTRACKRTQRHPRLSLSVSCAVWNGLRGSVFHTVRLLMCSGAGLLSYHVLFFVKPVCVFPSLFFFVWIHVFCSVSAHLAYGILFYSPFSGFPEVRLCVLVLLIQRGSRLITSQVEQGAWRTEICPPLPSYTRGRCGSNCPRVSDFTKRLAQPAFISICSRVYSSVSFHCFLSCLKDTS